MIGLGVGIDYALFIVTRYRDAYRQNGGDVQAALELAMNTAGRAILFAGATVVIALLGMFALGVSFLYGAAVAASLGVLLVLAASLTLLPALLMFTGKRIGRARRGSRPREARAGFWLRWVGLIQRRPAWAALGSTALLLALASPALGLRLGTSDSGNDPTKQTTRHAYDLLAAGFGSGFNGPLQLAVRLASAGDTVGLTRLTTALRHTPGIASVATPRLNPARDTAAIAVYPTTSPQSAQTTSLVKHLRNDVLPPLAKATGATVYVGGATATQVDFAHVLSGKLPLFIGMVVLLSALLLLIVFRSLLIPLQAAAMNLLAIAAALGVVQAIFERGWLGGLVGTQPGPIDAFIPVMVFAIVFGLSMDYEVFLVSRIHEEWQHRGDASAAVREGLARTGRVITAAAAVMVAVFASFAMGDDRVLKLFGIAMATAVFLDAVVTRSILLPAALQLFGRRTWAFPRWFDRRLPRLAIEPAPAAEPTPLLEEAASCPRSPLSTKLIAFRIQPTTRGRGALERVSFVLYQEPNSRRSRVMQAHRKFAVAGATGRVGRHVVDVLEERGYDVVAISRSGGVDVVTGEGLTEALAGVETVIDAATGASPEQQPANEFFTASARNLQQLGEQAGVERIVVVSIIGIDRFTAGYYAASRPRNRRCWR